MFASGQGVYSPAPLAARSKIEACLERTDLNLGRSIPSENVRILPELVTSNLRACALVVCKFCRGAGLVDVSPAI